MHRYIFGTSCITKYVVVIKLKYFLTLRQIRYRKQDSLSPPPATTLHHFVFFPFQTPISYSVWCFHSNLTAILFFLFHQNLSNLVSWQLTLVSVSSRRGFKLQGLSPSLAYPCLSFTIIYLEKVRYNGRGQLIQTHCSE